MSDSTIEELLPREETLAFLRQLARKLQRVRLSETSSGVALG